MGEEKTCNKCLACQFNYIKISKICFFSQEKAAVTLLRLRRTYRRDQRLQAALREAFALIGFVDPVKGRGIRVLSIDGGGTR